jgi:HEAT repeat protein
MLQLSPDGRSHTVLWTRPGCAGRFSHAVILDGRVYVFGNPRAVPTPAPVREGDACPAPPKGGPASSAGGSALLCLDARTGGVLHSEPAGDPGHVFAADGMVYAVDLPREKSRPFVPRLRLIEPTPQGFRIAGQFSPALSDSEMSLRDIEWQASACPTLADGRLFFRYGPLQVYELRADRAAEARATRARVASLVAALASEDPETRRRTLRELATFGSRLASAAGDVAARLQDSDPHVRLAAADALGTMGPAAIPSLVTAMQDETVWSNATVRAAFLRATLRTDDLTTSLLASAESRPALRDSIGKLLERIGPAATVPLIRLVESEERFTSWWALSVLKGYGPAASEATLALAEVTRSRDEWFRAHAARVLAGIGPDARPAVPALTELLKHHAADARTAAAEALAAIGDDSPPVLAALRDASNDKESKVSKAATAALKSLRDRKNGGR